MALQAGPGAEAVLKQPRQQRFFSGQGRQAVADVPRWLDPEFAPQYARAAAVIGDGHDRREVAAVALQPAEQGGEPCPAADGHDRGAAVQTALGRQGIHQQRVPVWRQCLLNCPEAAALSKPDQATAHHEHEWSGDLAGEHRRDVGQRPADELQQPIDRLQVSPNGGPQKK